MSRAGDKDTSLDYDAPAPPEAPDPVPDLNEALAALARQFDADLAAMKARHAAAEAADRAAWRTGPYRARNLAPAQHRAGKFRVPSND